MPSDTAPDVARLAGKKILITGGSGLIGSHVAERLLEAPGAEVLVLDNLSRGSLASLDGAMASGRVRFIEGDIRDRALLGDVFSGVDVLIHLAAVRLTHAAEIPRLAMDVMAQGTFNVLEAAVAARISRVVAASSASVYGLADKFPTDEKQHPYNNDTIYGAAKAFNEGLLASFRAMYGLPYVALRPFNVYGPRMDTHGAYTEVLIRWMERIERGQSPIIFGDGQQTMDFVYVDDVARAFVLASASDEVGEVFNVASGVETSLNQLAAALIAAMGARTTPEYAPARTVSAVPRRLGDPAKAKARLGFATEVKLADGLRRLVDWWRQTR